MGSAHRAANPSLGIIPKALTGIGKTWFKACAETTRFWNTRTVSLNVPPAGCTLGTDKRDLQRLSARCSTRLSFGEVHNFFLFG